MNPLRGQPDHLVVGAPTFDPGVDPDLVLFARLGVTAWLRRWVAVKTIHVAGSIAIRAVALRRD